MSYPDFDRAQESHDASAEAGPRGDEYPVVDDVALVCVCGHTEAEHYSPSLPRDGVCSLDECGCVKFRLAERSSSPP